MWPARAAIRPVAAHAVVPPEAVSRAEEALSERGDLEVQVERGLHAFAGAQPGVAAFLQRAVEAVHDDTAEVLGSFLGVVVWRAFHDAFGSRMREVPPESVAAVQAMFEYDEELRRGDASEMLESDDLVAIGQPHLVAFVREQIDASLEPDEDGEPAEVNLDDIATVYRALLVEILALGHGVTPPRGAPASGMPA
jgi:hypothetical protein